MERPRIALLVPPGPRREDILAGTKTVTIRAGDRWCPGNAELVLFCHIFPWAVMADVVSVRLCKLSGVTPEEWKDDGYDPAPTMENFVGMIKPFHPDFNSDSVVTIIRFANVRGTLVDEWKAAAQKKLEDERRDKGLCPKCGSGFNDHEIRNWNEGARDGDVYCPKCDVFVRYYNP